MAVQFSKLQVQPNPLWVKPRRQLDKFPYEGSRRQSIFLLFSALEAISFLSLCTSFPVFKTSDIRLVLLSCSLSSGSLSHFQRPRDARGPLDNPGNLFYFQVS